MRRVFTEPERRAVEQAEAAARELVGRYYVLSPREWRRLRYEVATLAELRENEVDDGALAQVLWYEHVGRAPCDWYRICLQDHRILERAGGSEGLRPLLLYVMTHEMLHVVRFALGLRGFDLPPDERPLEEDSVHRTASELLRHAHVPGIDTVLGRFEAHAC